MFAPVVREACFRIVCLEFQEPQKFKISGRKHKYSGEELAVAISHILGALSDSKYLAVNTTPQHSTIVSYLLVLIGA